MHNNTGKVYLIGAGPGDPDLITVKGRKYIQLADVIVYDYLASPYLLNYAREDAEVIYVGKKGRDHTLSQENINALLVEKGRKGLTIARLKGGDPFIFGRGGEEVEELFKAGIPFEIMPGVTSAIAAPAYAGIPLTHRKYTSSVSIITGHEDPSRGESNLNWEIIAKDPGTLVFLMGVKNLDGIATQLVKHGKSSDTPAALIHRGTTPMQKTITGTLDNIVKRIKNAGITSPSVIIVGDVIKNRDSMKWFENRPLFGKKIVVTRARKQASEFVRQLSALGAECLEYPTIKIVPPDDYMPLDSAIERVSGYDWIVFTSVNGVSAFFNRLYEKGMDVRELKGLKTAAIGPATSERLMDFGILTDILPESYMAESVVEAFKNEEIKSKKILLPRAGNARPILCDELKKMGAIVDEITTYNTIEVRDNVDLLQEQLEAGKVDMITFTSSSTVRNFRSLLPGEKFETFEKDVCIAAIGPITAETAEKNGFDVNIVADTYTIKGLCEAILKYYTAC
ncbi:MAG: uroporphyrinogen-III C-methyltransferase [Desulfobacteraceae bacterium]|nr:uroporphyrinogen-III C-methyltransferase [Desulfobacteraceae bacterium]